MQTRHPRIYGPSNQGITPGQVFEASEEGLTMRARNINPLVNQAFKASARGGATLNLNTAIGNDSFFVVDGTTGGLKINPELLP